MNLLEPFTVNPFYTIVASKENIQFFGYDHKQRMAADPNLALLLPPTIIRWEALFGNIEEYDTDFNLRVGLTKDMNAKMKEFIDKAITIEGLVAYKLHKHSSQYDEFYPRGLTEYHQINQSNSLTLMKRMIDASFKYKTELDDATLTTQFTNLRNDFKTLFDSQKTQKGVVDLSPNDFLEKKVALYDQLYKNMTFILNFYSDDPKKMLAFFDQTIVNYDTHPKAENAPYILDIPANGRAVADISFSVIDTLLLSRHCTHTLSYFFAVTATEAAPTNPHELLGNNEAKVKGILAGAPQNKYLIFLNPSPTEIGKVEISLK